MSPPAIDRIVAVVLNPAIDRVIEAPRLTIGRHQVVRTLARYAGGKAVNVARGLAGLEVPSTLTGFVGRNDAEFFAHELQGPRLALTMLPVAGRTRENITLVDPVSGADTHLRDTGFEITPDDRQALAEQLITCGGPGTLVLFSGSLPPGIDATAFAALLALCQSGGSFVAVDASGAALSRAATLDPWLIKPNRHELEELVERPLPSLDEVAAAAREVNRHVPLVLVSLGADGACLFAREAAWHARCPLEQERVRNTVGCGDALVAGFLAGVYRRWEWPEALRLGVAAATAAAISLTASFCAVQSEEFRARTMLEAL